MARKITEQAIEAFYNNETFKGANTTVELKEYSDAKVTILKLFGNEIAYLHHNMVHITNAGWKTNTTKERLNGLKGVSISQIKGKWYLNGNEWDGNLIQIK